MANPLLKEFTESVDQFKKIMKIVGIDVIDENFKYSWPLLVFAILSLTSIFSTFYSFYVTFVTSDFDAMMKVEFVLGVIVENSPRLLVIILWHKKFRKVFAKIEQTYKMTSTAKGSDVLAANLRVFRLVAKTVIIAYIVACCFFNAPPVLYYIFHGKRILMTELYLPGVDHKTIIGYAILTAVHLV
jgi:hypothetical protein